MMPPPHDTFGWNWQATPPETEQERSDREDSEAWAAHHQRLLDRMAEQQAAKKPERKHYTFVGRGSAFGLYIWRDDVNGETWMCTPYSFWTGDAPFPTSHLAEGRHSRG